MSSETGVFPHAPEVRCLLINEHTLCGDACDLYADQFGLEEFVSDEEPLPVSCTRCAFVIERVLGVELTAELVQRDE